MRKCGKISHGHWARTTIIEITTAEFAGKVTEINLLQLITFFKTYFKPSQNIYHSRVDFLGETTKQRNTRTSLGGIVRRDWEFKNIKPRDFMISKFITSMTGTIIAGQNSRRKGSNGRVGYGPIKPDRYDQAHGEELSREEIMKKQNTM